MEFRNITLAKIRRPHGLHGAVVVQILDAERFGKIAEKISENGEKIFVELYDKISRQNRRVDLKIRRIFGKVNDVCRLEFDGFSSVDEVQDFRNVFLEQEVDSDEFCLEDLVGFKLYDGERFLAKITAIHDFGAGLVVDSEKEMYSLADLDLESVKDGKVWMKNT